MRRSTTASLRAEAVELQVRILAAAPREPVVFVDGLAPTGSPVVLELSHWPGNRTPAKLRHDLSTGCALAFARLPRSERERLARNAVAFANNHYDTDGTLALFAARHPRLALPRAEKLLAAASAGDFFRWPSDEALAVDAIVSGRASLFANDDDLSRWNRCTRHLMEELPAILDGDLEPWRALWEPVLDAARADRGDLASCRRRDVAALDLTLFLAPAGSRSTRAGAATGRFDPGRHALFGATDKDRAAVLAPGADGTTCRLVVSTLSWFDLVSERRLPRPDLASLAARLDALEGTAPTGSHAWRAQSAGNASPELWFGGAGLESFAEHNDCLAPSRLAPEVLIAEIERALATGAKGTR